MQEEVTMHGTVMQYGDAVANEGQGGSCYDWSCRRRLIYARLFC